MTNYYEELMPIKTYEEDYLKYYIKESLPLFDKLNTIIKKGKPIQRQALLKNLIIYEKDSLFKSLINFIIDSIQVWDIETVLCLPKSLYEIIININYILDQEIFNTIFKHMILSLTSGFEKARNEYLFYFNKIIEFYSVIDLKNNNEIKNNFFPYKIKEEIIQLIIDLGIFGQTPQNRKLCCYLCSSICRIYFNKKEKSIENDIQKLYQRLNYLFWDVDKITEAQMTRELFYIIPLFYEEMFKSDDIIQALQSYINHDGDHVIQVMAIISLLKNIKYLNKKKENCSYIFNVLMNKIKEIIEDFDYESIFKNIVLHTLINSVYENFNELNTAFLFPIFQLGIMKNYYNFYKLDILFIKNFDKYFYLIEFFMENAPILEKKFNEEEKSEISIHKTLVEQIKSQINFEGYFIKIINEFFSEENDEEISDDKIDENNTKENDGENINNKENGKKLNETVKDKVDLIYNVIQFNNNKEKEKKNFYEEKLIFDENFLEENLDIIFNIKDSNKNLSKYIYNKDIIKKTLYLYLPKIIQCFSNIKTNKILSEKLFFLFEINNVEFLLNIYSSSMEYLLENNNNLNNNKNILKKHPLYQLLLYLLKKNLENCKPKSKLSHKNINSNLVQFETNFYNKFFSYILSNIITALKEIKNDKKNKGLILIGKIIKLLIPKIYKYFKNIIYTKLIDTIDINTNMNLSLNNYKDCIKIIYTEKIYEEIFDEIIANIIINKENLGNHIIKEYIEILPLLILYSKEKRKYYNFFIKTIFSSESFYMRKYAILFYQKCFEIFSMNFLVKNNFFCDFCMLLKDKVNLISLNAIELILEYIKKIICYSKEKFFEVCEILQEVYDNNTKALNNKNSDIIFDKDKNIIINKIIDIKIKINFYFSEDEFTEEKAKENKFLNNENILYRQINNNLNNTSNIPKEENVKINIMQKSKVISNNRYSYMINNNNKNIINNLSLSQKPKNNKLFEKPLKLIKDRGKHLSSKNTNVFKVNFFKEKKRISNIDTNNINININTIHYHKKYNSVIKNSKNPNNNKYFLPKLQEHEIKVFEIDNKANVNNDTQNIKSSDFSLNKYNLSEKKQRKNEQNNNNEIQETKNRLQSAKMNLMKSFNKECIQIKTNLNSMKIIDEKKNNQHNLRYSYDNENCNFANNLDEKNCEERPKSKIMRLNKNSFISNKIYIDANK